MDRKASEKTLMWEMTWSYGAQNKFSVSQGIQRRETSNRSQGVRRAVLKRGHRERRLRSSGVLYGEEVALRSWGFREEQNKT